MKFISYEDRAGEWRWRLVARNGQTVATPGEGFTTKASCERNIALVKQAYNAPVEELE